MKTKSYLKEYVNSEMKDYPQPAKFDIKPKKKVENASSKIRVLTIRRKEKLEKLEQLSEKFRVEGLRYFDIQEGL
jgi:hypothetical protein